MPLPEEIPSFTVALGGESVPVQYLDGRTALAEVRILKLVAMPVFFRVLSDEARLAELVCDKPEGWADTLTPGSLMTVIKKGTQLNFSTATQWAEHRLAIDQNAALLFGAQPPPTTPKSSVN
jgi:hypothetical protein